MPSEKELKPFSYSTNVVIKCHFWALHHMNIDTKKGFLYTHICYWEFGAQTDERTEIPKNDILVSKAYCCIIKACCFGIGICSITPTAHKKWWKKLCCSLQKGVIIKNWSACLLVIKEIGEPTLFFFFFWTLSFPLVKTSCNVKIFFS